MLSPVSLSVRPSVRPSLAQSYLLKSIEFYQPLSTFTACRQHVNTLSYWIVPTKCTFHSRIDYVDIVRRSSARVYNQNREAKLAVFNLNMRKYIPNNSRSMPQNDSTCNFLNSKQPALLLCLKLDYICKSRIITTKSVVFHDSRITQYRWHTLDCDNIPLPSTTSTITTTDPAFITSRVDYYNAVFTGSPKSTTDILTRVLNAAAIASSQTLASTHDHGLSCLLHDQLH